MLPSPPCRRRADAGPSIRRMGWAGCHTATPPNDHSYATHSASEIPGCACSVFSPDSPVRIR
jgi:hypothetical protein